MFFSRKKKKAPKIHSEKSIAEAIRQLREQIEKEKKEEEAKS